MLSLFIAAGILGLIISFVEKDGFPGWLNMIICVLAAYIPTIILDRVLPANLSIISIAVGAICAVFAIMVTCDSTPKRASISAGIYFLIQIAIGFALA